MKKTFIALASVASLTTLSTAALAQSSLTLYGIVDMTYGIKTDKTSSGDKTTVTGFQQNASLNPSRWGLKGSEDLSGGLKATFNLENGFTPGTGVGNTGFSRHSNIGLTGGFGTVKVGRQWLPSASILDVDDLSDFSTTLSSSTNQPMQREGNAITYANKFDPVEIQVGLVNESVNAPYSANDRKTQGFDVSAAFELPKLGINAVATYQSWKQYSDTNAFTKADIFSLSGAYDFKVAKVVANVITGTQRTDAGKQGDGTEFNLGVTAPVGDKINVLAGIGSGSYKHAGTGSKVKGSSYLLGANYAMSKRTDAYIRLSEKQDWVASGTHPTTSRFALGLRHTF